MTGERLSQKICEARLKATEKDVELGETTFSFICAALAGVLSTKLKNKEATLERAADFLQKIIGDSPELGDDITTTVSILSEFMSE